MNPMTNEEYVEVVGQQCPYCRSDAIKTVGQPSVESNIVWQPCECGSCGKEWTDQYKLTGYDPVS